MHRQLALNEQICWEACRTFGALVPNNFLLFLAYGSELNPYRLASATLIGSSNSRSRLNLGTALPTLHTFPLVEH